MGNNDAPDNTTMFQHAEQAEHWQLRSRVIFVATLSFAWQLAELFHHMPKRTTLGD